MMPWDTALWFPALIMLPLLAAIAIFLLGRRGLPWLPLATAFLIFLALLGLTGQVWDAGPQRYAIGGWGAPLGIDLYGDGLSLIMMWLTAGVVGLICPYALHYFHDAPDKSEGFWPLCLLLWAALNALFLAADIFNLYVTLELLTLAAVAMVTLAGENAALQAAMRYLLFTMLGSFCYLLGVGLIYGGYGVLDIIQLSQVLTPGPLSWVAVALITLGLLTKTAMFPLHVWLPPAHAGAPAPVSALLSALVVKASFYLLLRLWFSGFAEVMTPLAGQLLGILGAAAILYGSFQALRQVRLKLLIAYSTVAQLGYLMLVFPLAGGLAWSGAVLHALSHGCAKAALFLAAGNILHVLGHDRIPELAGTAQRMPLTFYVFGVAGISIMGLPPSSAFLAKWLFLEASLESGQWWWIVVILAGSLLAAVYTFRVVKYAFAIGVTPSPALADHAALPRAMEVVPLLLAFCGLILGFAGTPLLALLDIGSPFSGGRP